MRRILLSLFALSFAIPFIANAQTTIDFSTFGGAQVASADGVTFSLAGGDGPGGTPCACAFGNPALGNSPDGNYPTSQQLIFTFSSPVSDVSFLFDNFGDSDSGRGATTWSAYTGTTLDSSAFIGFDSDNTENVTGSDITSLVIDNGTGGSGDWEFGVYSLTFDRAAIPEFAPAITPEPASLVSLGTGLLGVAGSLYRRRRAIR